MTITGVVDHFYQSLNDEEGNLFQAVNEHVGTLFRENFKKAVE